MSSVDGARSLNVASDEIFENACGPCKYDGVNKEGTKYCNDCEDFLCQTCTDSHKRFKTTRNHTILSVKDASKSMIKSQAESCIVMCSCDQNLETTIYCEDHDEVICQTCKAVKHRRCNTCSLTEKSASYDIKKLHSVIEKTNTLQAKIQNFQADRNSDIQTLDRLTEDCKQQIKSCRDEFNSFFNTLEENMLSGLETCASEQRQVIQRLMSTCLTTNQLLASDSKLLKAANTSGKKDKMFASDVRISSRLRECHTVLQDLHEEAEPPILEFKENNKLMEMRKEIKELGTVNGKHFPCNETHEKGFVDLKVSNRRQFNIKLPGDEKRPWITGCAFMPDGDLVLCDCNNNTIKVLNSSFEVKGTLKLNWAPWDVSVVNSSNVIATFLSRCQIQFIQVTPKIQEQRVLNLDRKCYGIEVVGNEIFMTCHDSPGEGEIRILDMGGNVKRKIGVNHDQDRSFMFERPSYMTVSQVSGKIFVTDCRLFTVTCLTSDGNIVYQYNDKDLVDKRGLCVDTADNSVVCGQSSNNLQVVTANGKTQSVLLSSDDGIQDPCSVAYRRSDSHLVVGSLDNDNLLVFKLTL